MDPSIVDINDDEDLVFDLPIEQPRGCICGGSGSCCLPTKPVSLFPDSLLAPLTLEPKAYQALGKESSSGLSSSNVSSFELILEDGSRIENSLLRNPLLNNKLEPSLRWGSTSCTKLSMTETVIACQEPTFQIFLGDPTRYRVNSVSLADRTKAAEILRLRGQTVYVHCSLIANLAKADNSSGVYSVRASLAATKGLSCASVLHIGKLVDKSRSISMGIEAVASEINSMIADGILDYGISHQVPRRLLVEVAAGQGTEIGVTEDQLRSLFERIDYAKVGLCYDTQHGFASGLSALQSHEDVAKLIDLTEGLIGRRPIGCFHLNDSMYEFNSKRDRHAPLLQGHAWGRNTLGLDSLINYTMDEGLDLISETTDPAADQAYLMTLYQKKIQTRD